MNDLAKLKTDLDNYREFLMKHDRFVDNSQFQYKVRWNPNAIPQELFSWIQNNCTGRYSSVIESVLRHQYYEGHFHQVEEWMNFMTFEDKSDAIKFKLSWGHGDDKDEIL